MPISCEECRQNLGQLVPPQGPSSPETDRDPRANRTPETAFQETLETPEAQMAELEAHAVEALEVEAHVADCQSCSRELMRLRRMVGALGDLPVLPAPVDLRARIRSQLQAESVSTHASAATANAQEKAASPPTINAPGFDGLKKPQSVSNAPRLQSDLASGWSRFWTRALRHPAQATWAGGAVLCALAFVVASRTPTPLSPPIVSPDANERPSSPSTANAPAPKAANPQPGRSATRNGVSQKPPMGAAPSVRPNIAGQNGLPSGVLQSNPRRRQAAPSASDANSTSGSSSAVLPPTDSDDSLRASSTSPAPPTRRRNAKSPGAAQAVAGRSTHAAAQKTNAARGKARQLQSDAPVALSLPKKSRQTAANGAQRVAPPGETRAASPVPRLARLEVLPLETTPQAPPNPNFALSDAPGRSIARSGTTSSDADSARSRSRETARREQEADREAAPARRMRAPSASLPAPSIAAPSTASSAASSAAATQNGVVAESGRRDSPAARAKTNAGAPDAIAAAPTTPNSSTRDAAAGTASMTKGGAAAREEETAVKKLTPSILRRTGSANYIDNKLSATVNRSRRARLQITPGRDARKARVRVVLSGLAWSDVPGASDSKPRIVWQGQARRGREVEVPISLLPARASRDGRLRVELQGAKGESWETLQTQDIPVAFP